MPDAAPPPLDKLNPAEAWQPWEPDAKQPWNLKWAGHLYRRSAFGANLAELREAVVRGFKPTLDLLLNGQPDNQTRTQFLASVGDRIARKNNAYELRGWWVYGMLHTLHPLQEKLTLFWHNHFATSIAKVQRTVMMYRQNCTLREHALGKFRPFLLAMSKDPAMLVWLDSNSNVKGRPNENYAREVMELFSLGVGRYTETDIREAARAFTGWHTDDDQFEFNARLHDNDSKTVLEKTGNWNGDDIVRIVLDRDDAARFLVRKLYRYFVSETAEPPDAFLAPLADQFRKSNYDIAGLMKTMLSSRHFFSAYAYRQRIKSPVEFTVGAVRAVVGDVAKLQPASLISKMEAMGQQLFAPPNVKGWVHGQAWLNSATVLARHNFAQQAASGSLKISEFDRRLAAASNEFERRLIEEEQAAREAQEARREAEAAKQAAEGKTPPPAGTPPVPPPPPPLPGESSPPKAPEPPPPPRELDPAELIRREKITEPERIVDLVLDVLLQGDVTKKTRGKLVTFLADGKPQGRALDGRVREMTHAVMTMPEYQLA